MSESQEQTVGRDELLRMAVDVVSAYMSNNSLPAAQIPEMITSVYTTLGHLGVQGIPEKNEPARPAVPVKKSITPDYLVCLEDGKKLKMLKRHLRTNYSMTPEEYRAKWGLSPDYPMVAPNYAQQRSEFAKKIGLGRKPGSRGRKKGA